MLLGLFIGGRYAAPGSGGGSDPYTWPTILILFGSIALILGLTNWRLGLWFKEYNVRWWNIISGIIALLLGIILAYNEGG